MSILFNKSIPSLESLLHKDYRILLLHFGKVGLKSFKLVTCGQMFSLGVPKILNMRNS
jgi:hypothetical protein